MKKFISYIITGVLVIGGVSAYLLTRKPDTANTNNKSVITLDFGRPLCEQIPSSVVAEAIGKEITNTLTNSSSTSNVCQYYIDATNFVTLRLNNLSYENQKSGQTALDRTITTNNQIQSDHFVAVQENGLINDIVIKINDNMFLAVDRSSTKAADENVIVTLAAKVAEYIKNPDTNASKTSDDSAIVPEPQEQDIIRNFFQLIEEKDVSAAVLSMSSKNTSDDSVKQAWGVQFNDWNSVNITNIEASMPTEWSESRHTYKVTMDVVIDSSAANAPIPYYGYENGQNIRFIPIVKENGLWKVDGIATGP
jgi:hypothetical protein